MFLDPVLEYNVAKRISSRSSQDWITLHRLMNGIGIKMSDPFERKAVLDGQGWIELLDVMPDPDADRRRGGDDPYLLDRAIAQAARTSYSGESKGDEADKKLLMRLYKDKHLTPFEMVEFKFRVYAPVVVWWQWVRHRTMSYNFQSGRYTEFKEDQVYIPKEWRIQSKDNKQGSDGILDEQLNHSMELRLETHLDTSMALYKSALNQGVAKEQARFFLPAWCSMYTAIVKVDLRNLLGFLALRMAPDAQYEIRMYAQAIYNEILKPLCPWTSESFELYTLNKE